MVNITTFAASWEATRRIICVHSNGAQELSNFPLSVTLRIFGEFQASVYNAVLLYLPLDEGYQSSKCQHICRCLREPWTNLRADTILQQRKSPGLSSRKSSRFLSEYWFFWQNWFGRERLRLKRYKLPNGTFSQTPSLENAMTPGKSHHQVVQQQQPRVGNWKSPLKWQRALPIISNHFSLVERAVNHTNLKSLSHKYTNSHNKKQTRIGLGIELTWKPLWRTRW